MRPTDLQILLELSSAIASVKNKDDLFRVIVEKINPVFNFPREAIILTIDAEERNYRLMFGESSVLPLDEIHYYKSQKFPVEVPLRNILHSDTALILQTQPLIEAHPERAGAQIMKKLGVKELISCRLQVSGKVIGCFSLHADKIDHFSEDHIPLFKSVADIVAVAVANILAGEEAELKEHQKSQLLSISKHIANVRDKNDLFQLITNEFKTFIPFDIAVISVLNEESNSFGVFLANADERFTSRDIYKKAVAEVFPIAEGSLPWHVVRSPHPIIANIEEIYLAHPDIPYTRNAYLLGMREQILTRLVHSGKVIGAVSLVSTKHGTYTEREIQTLESLSNLFAIALNNILSNAELELREQQKSQLLNISSHIATVRDKKDLFHLVADEVKSFIPFDDLFIASVDEEKQTFSVFLSDAGQSTRDNENFEKAITQVHPLIKGTIPYRVYASETPFIIDIEEEYLKDKADYMRYAYEFGMKQEIVSRLVYSGKVIGLVGMLSKQHRYTADDIDVLQSLGNLLAIALYNISANEAIQRKESQKSHLLQISKHIATIREKEDLFRLIAVEMKSFIDFDDVVIALIDAEKQTYSVFLSDVGGTTSKHRDFRQANTQVYPIKSGGIVNKIYNSEMPVLVDIEREHFKDPEIDSLRFAYNFGMREEIVVRLTYSGKVIGMMGVLSKRRNRYTRADIETAQSLSSLVAIALNNVLANEELKRREQQKSQLLNISTHISTIRDKNDLFHLLTKEVRSFIDFDDAIISIIDDKMENFSLFVSDISQETGSHKDFDKVKNKVFPLIKGGIADQVIRSDKPSIIDIKKEMFRHPELEFLRYSYNFGFREEILIRLVHSGKVIGVFVLFSRTLDRFTERDATTLQSLSSLVAVALNNILANQEIENLSKQLEQDNLYLNEEIKSNYNFEEIIGESPAIQEIFKKVVQVAYVDSTVLVLGETGTGKELIARAIHNLSARKNRPLIKVNCAALPAQLIESELFGHEKGSFTGATDKRIGKFELANGSTIFLDEIGELPLELQAKLLRALQEKEIERIGSERSIKVDVRIIAATNRNLEKEVAENRFRSDLYYRLNIYPIELPALRDRKEDIPLLASFFLQKLSHKLGKKITSIAPNVMEELLSNDWPGNIRELEHTIERSMLLTTGKTITNLNLSKPVIIETSPAKTRFAPKKLAENERDLILNTLKFTKGKIRGKNGAAELLDILPTTLEARMKKLGIRKEFLTE